MLMASCSKNIEPSPSDPNAWIVDVTLPVPIEFGSPVVSTKGNLIEDLRQENGLDFGVFVVDRDSDKKLNLQENYWLRNDPAILSDGKFSLKSSRYYPMTNERSFNFYAYYTHLSNNQVEYKEDKVYVIIPQVGSYDVLYGSAVAESIVEVGNNQYIGFNAAYIRKGGDKPKIDFKHATAAVQFYIKTTEDKKDEWGEEKMWVSEIYLNVLTKGKMCLIDRATDNNSEGQFAAVEGSDRDGDGVADFFDVDGDGVGDINKLPVVNGKLLPDFTNNAKELGKAVGDPVFLIPGQKSIPGTIKLARKDGVSLAPVNFELDYNLQAGFIYNIALLVHSPEEITFEVTVQPWQDGFKDAEEDFGTIEIG